MSQSSLILLLSLAYLGLLFVIAHAGERHAINWSRGRLGPLIYALSLAIYCTSWTFYGSVGRAVSNGLDFALIYVGPALVIVLAWPVMARIVALAKQQNVTSIADILGARYGRSRAVAVIATLIAVVGAMPYIALQLQAVSFSFEALSGEMAGANPAANLAVGALHVPIWQDTALIVTLLMAAFTILFGVRHVEASEQHRGMMLAIAIESLVKLCALLAGGVFIVWSVFDGPAALLAEARDIPAAAHMLNPQVNANWAALTVLSGFAFLCLPRQFHVAVVEHDHPRSLLTARWMFPIYLVAINIFVVPIAMAGLARLDNSHVPDFFVLTLPLSAGADWLTAFIFIGGLSAATSMVAVACMALSGMVGNELVMPWLLRRRQDEGANLGQLGLLVRRLAVIVILLAAYAYYRTIAGLLPLVTIGLISFCAVANFAPPLLIGLYWRRAHRHGVIAGLLGGFAVWFWAILWPTIQPTEASTLPPWGPLAYFDPLLRGFVLAMVVNVALLVVGSLLAKPMARDRQQAAAFVGDGGPNDHSKPVSTARTELDQLMELAARFIGAERAEEAFRELKLSGAAAVEFTERLLSGTIGAASARVVVTTARRKGLWMPGSVREMLDEATAAIRYNADLLRRTLDHMGLGLAVFDATGKLEVWNDRFAILSGMERESLAVGINIATLPSHIPMLAASLETDRVAMRELKLADGSVTELRVDPLLGGGVIVTANDVTARVRAAEALRDSERRTRIVTDNVPVLIAYIDRDETYRFTNRPYQASLKGGAGATEGRHVRDVLGIARYQQLKPHIDAVLAGNVRVFEIDFPTNDAKIEVARGTYIPHFDESNQVLGFFLLYVDITERRQAEAALRNANEGLERRVATRTAELEAARARAEDANIDKTRFIAAASHDLLQPLHAARLFVAALSERHVADELVAKVDLGLSSVEALLDALLDIAKLDAGAIKPEPRAIPLAPLLQSLADAFAPLAERANVELRVVASKAWVTTDPALLRRVLQNYLSNAIRYGRGSAVRSRVLMGCRRVGADVRIEVRDNGPGIAANQQTNIYQEFIRLKPASVGGERGLGLGLAIVDRIARMLGHKRGLISAPGKGAAFTIDLPRAVAEIVHPKDVQPDHARIGVLARAPFVICVDDEEQVREGMEVLLQSWGCDVITAPSADLALAASAGRASPPDLLLIDLHLGDEQPDGINEIAKLRDAWGDAVPAALITANRDPIVMARAKALGLDVLHKPVKPAKLRALIAQRSQRSVA